MTIDKRHVEWLDRRNIDVTIAEKFGVTTTRDASGFWLTVPFTEAGKPVNNKYRRALVKRFPYAVFFSFEGECVTIHSVFHTSQNPKKWMKRLSE